MNLLDFLFPKWAERQQAKQYFRLLSGYQPVWHNWRGKLYESELVRAAIDAKARHVSKLQLVMPGEAQPRLRSLLKNGPNAWQTWSQFLYRTSTILDARNTCFIVQIFDRYGEHTGIYPICPESWELVTVGEEAEPWLRFTFANNQRAAQRLRDVGILTKFQYSNDLFGESNAALRDTMELIQIQRQGIEESAKNSATYRLMARVSNFSKTTDLRNERERFDRENFQDGGGGILLMPNTYTDIQQLKQQSYAVDADQMKLIQGNVFNYFGVNEEIIQNKAFGDAFSAFYEGALEPFAVQLSDVLTRQLFTDRERSFGNKVFFTANRLQFMTNADKLAVSRDMLDRGIMSINEIREIWNLDPVDGGDVRIIRGEYYNADDKVADGEAAAPAE